MCGIVALFGFEGADDFIEEISTFQTHRGPDNMGYWSNEHVSFSHQRLSIIDTDKRSNQPFIKKNRLILFNGEIYNYKDIKKDLTNKGISFSTESDTEVLLEAYNAYGEECLNLIEGMFAFLIYDIEKNTAFVARDHFGIKPLYYYQEGNKIAIASELKTLTNIPGFNKSINKESIVNVINYLWLPGNETIFSSIKKVPPASIMKIEDNLSFEIKQYWDIEDRLSSETLNETTSSLDKTIKESIKKHLVSDVPLGSFLSGGLDSSLISVLAKKELGKLNTYTIATEKKDKLIEKMPEDEKYALSLSKKFNFNHNEILIEPNIVEDLSKVVSFLDEPIGDPAAINTFLICEAARKKGIKVLLSGMGADEIFFGYRRQKATLYAEKYKKLPKFIRSLLKILVNKIPVRLYGSGLRTSRWAKKFLFFAEKPTDEAYRLSYSYYSEDELKKLFTRKFHSFIPEISKKHNEIFNKKFKGDLINQMCFTDINYFMNGLNLNYTDRASMAASIEVRVPFIDKQVVEKSMEIRGSFKFRKNQSKFILKKVAEKYLPKNIIYRKKASFGAPIRSWISKDLAPMVDSLLSEENVRSRGLFSYSYVNKLIQDDRLGKEDNAYRLYQLLTLELWFREYID